MIGEEQKDILVKKKMFQEFFKPTHINKKGRLKYKIKNNF